MDLPTSELLPTDSRFFDPDTGGPARIELRGSGPEEYAMLRRLGYRDRHHDEPFVVPADLDTFRTDLTSVPVVLSWLLPRVGVHLPAALIHDALVESAVPGANPVHEGPAVTRAGADLVFRRAMIDVGSGRVRSWLAWSGVSVATMWRGASASWATRLPVLLTALVVVVVGTLATLDLFDVTNVLPWMGDRPFLVELGLGVAAAMAVPTVLAVFWGRWWAAGVIGGVALALLLHVTVAIAAISGLYLLLERLLSGPEVGGRRTR